MSTSNIGMLIFSITISVEKGDISSLGHIVGKCKREDVKEKFKILKEKIQKHQDAMLTNQQGASRQSLPNKSTSTNLGLIRVPDGIRRILTESFENLGWFEAEYFLQTLGTIFFLFQEKLLLFIPI